MSTAAGTIVVGFCAYMHDFIAETWERHRLWGITYPSSDKYFITPLRSFARSSAYVAESAYLPIPISLVLHFFLICLFTIGVVFFPCETSATNCCLTCYLSLNRCILNRPLQIVTTTFLYGWYLLHCVKKSRT